MSLAQLTHIGATIQISGTLMHLIYQILVVQISTCIRLGVEQLGIPCPQALLSHKALLEHVATQASTNPCSNMLEQGFIAD